MLSAMSGTGSRLLSNFKSPLYICIIYPADKASLETAGSSVNGSVLVIVRTPLPEEEVGEGVVFDDGVQPLRILPMIKLNANNK